MIIKKPELLSPAGDMERLQFALTYGADAVYLAGTSFGMRASAGNFNNVEMAEGVKFAHEKGKKVCVTVNIMAFNNEIIAMPDFLSALDDMKVDAVIVADLGVMSLAKKYAPHTEIHISTQANITNYEAARMYHDLGASRVVLARELTLNSIAEIRAKTPKTLELEAFVHGAMCMSYSGRCMLSHYLTGRDANHGACAQPCRWNYVVSEEHRPGEYFPVEEDAKGTYIFNSKDMCMIEHIPELMQAGIDCFKIEGRAKTFYYTAVVTSAYRQAIDLYCKDPLKYNLPQEILEQANNVSHRHYFTGFYFGDKDSQYHKSSSYIRNYDVCAIVESCDESQNAVLSQRNKFFAADDLELLLPSGEVIQFSPGEMRNDKQDLIESAPHAEMKIFMQLPKYAPKMSIIRKKMI